MKKLHHCVRYFIVLGIISFVGHVLGWNSRVFLSLCGPAIYAAALVKKLIALVFKTLSWTETIYLYALLFPAVIIYFAFAGYLIKELWNERGFVRLLSLLVLILFLIFIHLYTGHILTGYFLPAL